LRRFFQKAALPYLLGYAVGKLVWLASYPKSGNTWLRVFLHNFLLQPETPHSINALTDISVVNALRYISANRAHRLPHAMRSKRVLPCIKN
jgi:hypothetical protein